MCRSIHRFVLVLILLGLLASPAPLAARHAADAGEGISAGLTPPLVSDSPLVDPVIVEANDHHIVLEWIAPSYHVVEDMVNGRAVQRVDMPDCPMVGQAGEPELPACTVLLGVPPDAALELRILGEEHYALPGIYALPPIPEQVMEEKLPPAGPESFRSLTLRWIEGPVYRQEGLFPVQVAALGEPAFLRHQRLVAVRFYPLQYAPSSGELVYHPRVRLEVTFSPGTESMGTFTEPDSYERLLEHTLLNYDQALQWRRITAQPLVLPPVPPGPGWRIPVRQDGVYQLTYQRLQDAGLPVDSLDPRTLRLYRYGQEVAIHVVGEEDGQFDSADYVLFFGQALSDNRYTDIEPYWLTYGGADGRRMAQRDGTPRGGAPIPLSFAVCEHREVNYYYYNQIPWRADHDHWFWNYTFPEGGVFQQAYTFPAHPLSDESYTSTLSLYLHSVTSDDTVDPDHHIRIWFNDTLLDELWWDGRIGLTPTLTFPSALLQTSGNAVRIEAPGDTGAFADVIYYDWLELAQRRLFHAEGDRLEWAGQTANWEYRLDGFTTPALWLFDVSDPDAPVEIVSATVVPVSATYDLYFEDTVTQSTNYLAVAHQQLLEPDAIVAVDLPDLRDPANGADYIVISHGDFYTQALALASFRAGQGLRALAVDVTDLYDLFAYGRPVPEALHDFLGYAYENWIPPAPESVILLGDGHYDPKGYRSSTQRVFILPYLAFVDPWLGETAADNRYVCVSEEDTLPDMHLGRLPANTADEAQIMVNKIIAYESAPPPGDWRQQALFVADDADEAGDFAALSDALIADLYPAPYEAQRVYLGVTHPYESPSVAARGAIIAAIDQGRVLINYIGHGAYWLWATERLLDNSDLSDLHNSPLLPVALPMTCQDGSYHLLATKPVYYSIAETYLRASGKGWIASWSPTGLGVSTGHDYLNRGFFQAVFLDDERQLGAATMAGKLNLWASGSNLDLLDTYLLFGDPALEMPLLETDLALDKTVAPGTPLQPGDPVTLTISLANAGPATAHHVVLTDTLSPYVVDVTVQTAGLALTARPGTRYVWDVEDMVTGQSGVVTITARMALTTPVGLRTNQARVATTAQETDLQNNADLVTWQTIAGPPYAIGVTADPPALPADGASLSFLLAHVVDTAGNPVAEGTPVAFATDYGTFADGSIYYQTTTAEGDAEAFLRAASEIVTATVTVTSGQAVGEVAVPFLSTEPYTIVVTAFPTAIPVTGTAAITATVWDILGHAVQDGTGVTLTTTLGALTPTLGATQDGVVTATLQGEGQSGLAAVVARSGDAAGVTQVRIGTGSDYTLTLAVTPAVLPADGQSTALVTATLVRADGQPITTTHWVTFSTTLGSVTPTVRLAYSGTATTTLTAGTRTGTALLLATAERESAFATVAFRPGPAALLTLTVSPPGVPVGGASAVAAASVRDAYGNKVADGTPVTFTTDLGTISPTVGATQRGQAYAVVHSGLVAGTATVLASSGPVTDTATVCFTPLGAFTVTLTATPTTVVADGQSPAALTAWVRDRYGNAVADGTLVDFYTNLGTLWPPQAGTVQGWATATLTSTAVGTATVQCFAGLVGNAEDSAAIRFIPGPPAVLLLTANPGRLYADGVSTATVSIYLWDGGGHTAPDGTLVTLSTSRGTIVPGVVATVDGRATATLRSSNEPGWATVHAVSGPAAKDLAVEFYQERVYLPLVGR